MHENSSFSSENCFFHKRRAYLKVFCWQTAKLFVNIIFLIAHWSCNKSQVYTTKEESKEHGSEMRYTNYILQCKSDCSQKKYDLHYKMTALRNFIKKGWMYSVFAVAFQNWPSKYHSKPISHYKNSLFISLSLFSVIASFFSIVNWTSDLKLHDHH